MTKLHLLSLEERESYFRVAAEKSAMPFEIIEKDFWVVWILDRLFSINDLKNHLTFKGGTSLSKIYGVIERFSEDVDLSIEKNFLGFDNNDEIENAASKKKQRAGLDRLSTACSAYIQNNLITVLRTTISNEELPEKWHLEVDESDPDGQTLQFKYPSYTTFNGYIRPSIKIELGARSDHWPVSRHKIKSYAKTALEEKISEPDIYVKVLDAKRTFWEKATILHQYAHLPSDKKIPQRISRHYYDFFCLLNSSIKDDALAEPSLLDRVTKHKSIYFSSSWANYSAARIGSLKLLPSKIILDTLEGDYALMKDMFFGKIPVWQDILQVIKEFEMHFNQQVQVIPPDDI
ncbi:MAG TPA: nucleotidyl transferase AbiEii/AbiGii toxin family protein [Gammaproteobacteria bacterium]|nr:nucleotidyl transferase AbiEii/AbiGii toxin family protein [Gammaproteobacteria bacterium]